jgi:hypothetical protein
LGPKSHSRAVLSQRQLDPFTLFCHSGRRGNIMRLIHRLASIVTSMFVAMSMAGGASAQGAESEVVFTRKSWEVRIVAFPDQSLACVARVQKPGSSFSIWADGSSAVQLQFFSTAWSFGKEAADIVVQIDRRAKWDLTNADLSDNSILFGLPNSKASERFLVEVTQGNRAKLFNTNGQLVEQWSLAGSMASINALIECAAALKLEADPNPFD